MNIYILQWIPLNNIYYSSICNIKTWEEQDKKALKCIHVSILEPGISDDTTQMFVYDTWPSFLQQVWDEP